jgi:hypothetical protein
MGRIALLATIVLAMLLAACGGGSQGSGGSILPGVSRLASSTSAPSASATGVITAVITNEFAIETNNGYGLLDVYTNGSTTFTGAAPYVGEQVTVTGSGSESTSITATSVTQVLAAGALATSAPIPMPSPTLSTIAGTVVALNSEGVQLDTSVNGLLWVATTSSTTYFGGKPVIGDYESVAGTGSVHTSYGFSAIVASQSVGAPSNTSVSGTIVGGTPYGFTLDVSSSYPAVPVVLTGSSVVAAGVLEAGAQASITGTGSTATSVLGVEIVVSDPTPKVSPTPTPTPITQTHVITADYLGAPDGTTSVTGAQAAPYLNWAQTGYADANALSAAGIKTQIYYDPNRVQTDEALFSAPSSAFAQTCSGVDVTDYFDSVTQYVMNPSSTALQSAYAADLTAYVGGAHFDSVFQDDTGPLSEMSVTFTPSLPCNYSDAAWISGSIALGNAAPFPVVFNGLSILDGENPSMSIQILGAGSTNTIGANFEGCYTTTSQAENDGWLWLAEENTELQVNALSKQFWCMERNTADGSQSTAARIYAYASFLLTYNPTLDVMWEDFGTTSGLHVFPEEQLVALDPVVATPASVASLEESGGAYGRQYSECFVAGKFVGACAVAVNPNTGTSVPFPFPQFTHTLTLSGYGTLDGGTLSTQGAAPPEYLAADSAEIVFP